jgi:hypothetical protein
VAAAKAAAQSALRVKVNAAIAGLGAAAMEVAVEEPAEEAAQEQASTAESAAARHAVAKAAAVAAAQAATKVAFDTAEAVETAMVEAAMAVIKADAAQQRERDEVLAMTTERLAIAAADQAAGKAVADEAAAEAAAKVERAAARAAAKAAAKEAAGAAAREARRVRLLAALADAAAVTVRVGTAPLGIKFDRALTEQPASAASAEVKEHVEVVSVKRAGVAAAAGDVLVSVNGVDISAMAPEDAFKVLVAAAKALPKADAAAGAAAEAAEGGDEDMTPPPALVLKFVRPLRLEAAALTALEAAAGATLGEAGTVHAAPLPLEAWSAAGSHVVRVE